MKTVANNVLQYAEQRLARPMQTLSPLVAQIYVPPHPLIQHWLAIARNEATPPPIFRAAIAELGRLLVYELGRDWLPTMQQQVYTPVGPADATFVDPTQPVKVKQIPPSLHFGTFDSALPELLMSETHLKRCTDAQTLVTYQPRLFRVLHCSACTDYVSILGVAVHRQAVCGMVHQITGYILLGCSCCHRRPAAPAVSDFSQSVTSVKSVTGSQTCVVTSANLLVGVCYM